MRLVRVAVITLLPFTGTLAASETMQAETQTGSDDRWPTPVFHYAQDPSRYVRLTAALQLWLRRTDLNPGSAVSGQPAAEATDLSVRRLRFGAWLVPSEKTTVRLNFGFNNLNRLTKGNVDLELLDAYGEFQATNEFHIGAGKSGWNGLSRYASPNPMTALTYDLPMIAIPTVNVTDNLLRNLGIFIKGQINRLDYRVTAYHPTSVEDSTTEAPVFEEDIAEFRDEDSGNSTGFSGYLKWQFFEHESNASAFSPGTYLGEKKSWRWDSVMSSTQTEPPI